MLLPYGTDAPLYHPPVVTLLMIALNVGIFFAEPLQHLVSNDPEQALDRASDTLMGHALAESNENYRLQFGHGLKPWQWITATFLHAHLLHLLGNMIFLWVFGLIVEGKLGWWKFLLVYLGIAAAWGFFTQGLMLLLNPNNASTALGASGVVYGLMGMALVWAPWNSVQAAVVLYQRFVRHFDIPVIALAGFYLLTDLYLTIFHFPMRSSFQPTADMRTVPSTELLHTLGAVVGVALGLALLKWKLVDCENWDLLSYAQGKHQMSYSELKAADTVQPDEMTQQGLMATARTQIQAILRQGDNPQLAYKAHCRMRDTYPSWQLPDGVFLILIKQLCQKRHNEDAVAAMQEYLQTGGPQKNQVRLKLAEILLDASVPSGNPAGVLARINPEQLNPREKALLKKLASRLQVG